jgi:hypothetical protein
MSDSTTNLDLISPGQAQKEVTANAAFNAASPAMLYANRASTTAALTWGYYGGWFNGILIANATLALTASTTNYLVADRTTGVVSTAATTTNWNNLSLYLRLYLVVASSGSISSYQDFRQVYGVGVTGIPNGGLTGQVLAKVSGTDADVTWWTPPAAVFDVHAFFPGLPGSASVITRIPVARAVSFPAGLTGSYGVAATPATAQTDFDVRKNGLSVGAIRFAAAATTATFIAASPIMLAAGDTLSIRAPATPDSTLADVGFVLAGTR